MAAPFLSMLSEFCPRLVSSAQCWGESDCPFVEMLGHTGPLPSLTTLEGIYHTFAHQEMGYRLNQLQGLNVQTGLAQGSGRRMKGLFVARVYTSYCEEGLPATSGNHSLPFGSLWPGVSTSNWCWGAGCMGRRHSAEDGPVTTSSADGH